MTDQRYASERGLERTRLNEVCEDVHLRNAFAAHRDDNVQQGCLLQQALQQHCP